LIVLIINAHTFSGSTAYRLLETGQKSGRNL